MPQTCETPPLGAAGLGDSAFPGGNSNSDIARNPAAVQAAFVSLTREFIAECLRIASVKASHGADNIELGDDLNAARDIDIAIQNLREGAKAFRELQAIGRAPR